MTHRKRYLFATMDTGGDGSPEMSVARALVERGHDVRVLADALLAPDVAVTGAEHVEWDTAPQRGPGPLELVIRDFETKVPMKQLAAARDGAMTGPAGRYATDVRAELRRRPADVVVVNPFLLGAQIGAEAEGVPVRAAHAEPHGAARLGRAADRPGLQAGEGPARRAARRARRAPPRSGCSTAASTT